MTSLFGLPLEIYTHRIFPLVSVGAVWSLNLVSKATNALIRALAKEPQEDITLEGKSVVVPADGPEGVLVTTFFWRKLRMDTLRILQGGSVADELNFIREKLQKSGGDLENIASFFKGSTASTSPVLALALVPFDFMTKQIPATGDLDVCSLGSALTRSIFEKNSQELVRAIFVHPNGVNIPAVGVNSLEVALDFAVEQNKPKIVEMILSHPNAVEIPATELEYSLEKAKTQGQQKIVDMISDFLQNLSQKVSSEDTSALLRLEELLEQSEEGFSLVDYCGTFDGLSKKTQHHIYEQLCEVYGDLTGNPIVDGIEYTLTNPRLILPIIKKLKTTYNLRPVSYDG